MAFSDPAPLARELALRLPPRSFRVEFWDGTELPATFGDGDGAGPTF